MHLETDAMQSPLTKRELEESLDFAFKRLTLYFVVIIGAFVLANWAVIHYLAK